MSQVVHARLDPETHRTLVRLRRRLGPNDSEIIRRAIRALAGLALGPGERVIIGLGAFASGKRDLGSEKRHLDGFGRP